MRYLLLVLLLPVSAFAAEVTGKVRVVDGDSLRLNGHNIRLYGIDAPERDQTCVSSAGVQWDCGKEVTQVLRAELKGKPVTCKLRDKDDYGRDLAVCFVAGRNLNGWLVEQGLAFAFRRYSMMFDLQEKQALVNQRGLHAHEVMRPAAHRQAKRQQGAQVVTGECVIKGNISASGKIYHMPGQYDYGRTRINLGKGERMFCSEAQARAAGWRRARR